MEKWERSSPNAEGLRQAGFDRIEAFLTEKCGGQPWRAAIVHRGRLIWERAAGLTPDEPLPSNSIVKSVIASCAGIALDSGLLPPLSDRALDHFPELLAHVESYPEIADAAGFTKFVLNVSFEMLLDHTGGFFKTTKKPGKGLVYGTVPSIVLLNIMARSAGRYHPENIHLGDGTGELLLDLVGRLIGANWKWS